MLHYSIVMICLMFLLYGGFVVSIRFSTIVISSINISRFSSVKGIVIRYTDACVILVDYSKMFKRINLIFYMLHIWYCAVC